MAGYGGADRDHNERLNKNQSTARRSPKPMRATAKEVSQLLLGKRSGYD
jgi:hypothetical protein